MSRYYPLIIVVIFSIGAGAALLHPSLDQSFMAFMANFSGIFFLFLATLKFWDLKGFKEAFCKYDLLAMRVPKYAYVYPFLELLIAIAYLAHFFLSGVGLFTAILMAFGALGVVNAVIQKKDLSCGCMGTKLNLPLTTVSIVENVFMGTMAVFIAIHYL